MALSRLVVQGAAARALRSAPVVEVGRGRAVGSKSLANCYCRTPLSFGTHIAPFRHRPAHRLSSHLASNCEARMLAPALLFRPFLLLDLLAWSQLGCASASGAPRRAGALHPELQAEYGALRHGCQDSVDAAGGACLLSDSARENCVLRWGPGARRWQPNRVHPARAVERARRPAPPRLQLHVARLLRARIWDRPRGGRRGGRAPQAAV